MNLILSEQEEVRIKNILNMIESGGFDLLKLLDVIDSLSNIEDKYFLTVKTFLAVPIQEEEEIKFLEEENLPCIFFNSILKNHPNFYLSTEYQFNMTSSIIRNNFDLAFLGVQLDVDNFNHISDELKNNPEFVFPLLKDFPELRILLPQRLRDLIIDL